MWIVRVGDIVEEDHRIVLGGIPTSARERALVAAYVFLIRLPRNLGIVQQRDKVELRALVIDSRAVVVRDAKIGTCLQPQIIRFAWVIAWRVVVLLGV